MAAPLNPQKFDAIVIGAGISGFSAALALKKKNKTVAVVAKTGGASSVSSGAWDFGAIPQGATSLESAIQSPAWQSLYEKVLVDAPEFLDREAIIASAEAIQNALSNELKLNFSFKKSFTLPLSSGAWKQCFGAQEIQTKADLSNLKGKRIGLVTSEHWRFRADLVLKKWQSDAEAWGTRLDLSPLWLDLAMKGADWPLPHVATRLQADETFRSQLIDSIGRSLQGSHCDTLLFPPLFLEETLPATIEKQWKVQVAECLATVEPVAGFRLTTAIRKTLEHFQIPMFWVSEARPLVDSGVVKSLSILEKGQATPRNLSAQNFVLASGKFFGGGIELGYQKLQETVFQLPLYHSRQEPPVSYRSELPWEAHAFHEEQPWARLGTWADAKWRPRDSAKNAALKNVVVCGSGLGGVDFAKEGLGLGFMAYTGRQSANVLY